MSQSFSWYRTGFILGFLLSAGVASWAQTDATVAEDEFGDATLRDWVQPQYPAAAAKAKKEGQVVVEFIVEADGRVAEAIVKESTDPLFDEAALAAVRQWGFGPAVENGKPVRGALTVPVRFELAQLKQARVPLSPPDHLRPRGFKPTPARATVSPDPEYPTELELRKLPGVVKMEFTVDAEGRTAAPRVLWASHAAFVESALRAMEKWEFEPARQGPLAKATTIQAPVEFGGFGTKRTEVLAANRITVVTGSSLATPPGAFVLPEPVYPLDRLLAGEAGAATAEFEVDERGAVSGVTIVESSAPEYAAALRAAVEGWGFQPALDGTAQTAMRLRVAYEFTPPDTGAAGRLAGLLRPGGGGIGGASGLDQRLKPLWRGFPVYPAALLEQKAVGQAEIEFIIDRDGRARLPRVKSATHEEFGWAAATAISQWVFERPRRQGEPVDITVSIPVQFAPPAQ